ncbi:MAG: hypothetical protein M1833_000913 [Piccolia ochrophora]|nr:MAG: hypothetical protein M1833_000913 [Piccolia ochrophora]
MSNRGHTYGPTCRLARIPSSRPQASEDSPPSLKAHFFYTSAVPIDDPLSPLPPPSSGAASTAPKHPPRPFSAFDNAALEEAWGGLEAGDHKYSLEGAKQGRSKSDKVGANRSEALKVTDQPVARRTGTSTQGVGRKRNRNGEGGDHTRSHSRAGTVRIMQASTKGDHQVDVKNKTLKSKSSSDPVDAQSPRASGSFPREGLAVRGDKKAADRLSSSPQVSNSPYGASPNDKDTTGTPFLRAPARTGESRSPARNVDEVTNDHEGASRPGSSSFASGWENSHDHEEMLKGLSVETDTMQDTQGSESPAHAETHVQARVPVGVSRLHLVEFPDLIMNPIYWSPVNDVSSVVRGTWFYKDSMTPVEAEVANQLEVGYLDLKPWTETWDDELKSAISFGAEGEERVPHRIWPEEERLGSAGESRPVTASMDATTSGQGQSLGSNMAEPPLMSKSADGATAEPATSAPAFARVEISQHYANSSVIYANATDAFILRPSLLPSAYYGRRPLARIRKGNAVGIQVVRGFDWNVWEKLHPQRNTRTAMKAEQGAATSQSGTASSDRSAICQACQSESGRENVTDLILIIHGVGQKLSERIESYHFTHAINSFRRLMHVALGDDAVRRVLRPDVGGMMALPINWRSTLSFEAGGPPPDVNSRVGDSTANEYSLKEITPHTIPAIRNIISDVMLDIPYYLSHHKPKMIQAVIKEANRVYRLWCKNNPGFERNGRVHLIAHSLGSVMALDILSNQPTELPQEVDLTSSSINDKFFDFDTKSLFMCGSPAGFFLLLNRATLIPRKGRNKPGAEDEDAVKKVAGEAGTYGCLAVDNIYNILNYNDPVAYKLTSTVDAAYAASLKPAAVPSATTPFLTTLTSAFRAKPLHPTSTSHAPAQKPNMARFPSTVELETHNFTREELAERRAHLLNDNGQIDWFLSSGGGPLEIQYLNMLGAHSSYWVSRDFVRFLVMEIGRARGREGTLVGVRAVKKGFGR